MRIALLQINEAPASPEANADRIEKAYCEAIELGARLVVASEMSVPSISTTVRLSEARLKNRMERESRRLQAITGVIPLIFGTCSPNDNGQSLSELWWCERGMLRAKIFKEKHTLGSDESIATFGAEAEVFAVVDYLGEKIGLLIGENFNSTFEPLVQQGISLIINSVASECALGSYVPKGRSPSWMLPSKMSMRLAYLSKSSVTHSVPIVYINRTGADGSLLFDGGSCLVMPDGTIQASDAFYNGIIIVDTNASGEPKQSILTDEGPWLRKALKTGIHDNLSKHGLEAVVIGLSGGVDSAVVAAMVAETIDPKRILGVAMPTRFTSNESTILARSQAKKLGVNFIELDADVPYISAVSSLMKAMPNRQFGLTDENLQSRCRGALLMALTTEPEIHQLLGTDRCVVLNAGNKSEAATGYFTMYGDAIGAFAVIGDLLKARVYTLAHELGDAIPKQVITRPPTAELRPHQTDESSLMPYRQLDTILGALIEAGRSPESINEDLAEVLDGRELLEALGALPRILKLMANSEFKRKYLPFALNVTHRTKNIG